MERRPRTLKHGDTFALFDHNGDIVIGAGGPEGIFHRDTRHLSHLRLSLDGARPMLLRSGLRDDNAALICDLSNPDLYDAAGRLVLRHDTIHIRRVRLLWDATAYERIADKNFDQAPQRLRLTLTYAADFEATVALCAQRNVAVQTIKALARGPWAAGATRNRSTWYQPLEDEADIRAAVHWVVHRLGRVIHRLVGRTVGPTT